MKKLSIMFVIAALTIGCSSNQETVQLKSQVDALEKQQRNNEEYINELQSKISKYEQERKPTAVNSVWEWTKQHAAEAWNGKGATEARARFAKCWHDLNTDSKK